MCGYLFKSDLTRVRRSPVGPKPRSASWHRTRLVDKPAQLLPFFPFTTQSLKPFMADVLLPLIYGVLTLGWPGVGKTPMLIAMGLALGRFHIQQKGLDGVKPARRRAKALDNFRHRVGQVHEALILDDPDVDSLNMSDIKSWMTSEEDQNCSGRYNDVKMVRNNLRAIASNDLEPEKEPSPDNARRTITSKKFMALTHKFFQRRKEAHVLAVLKRSVVMILGCTVLYPRLPSQEPDAIVHRIHTDDLHLDLFSDRDNPQYAVQARH